VTAPIPVHLAVEDELSEAVLRAMLWQSTSAFAVGRCYSRGGSGYLLRTIAGFNNAAKGCPFFVVTDLDSAPCPPELVSDWLSRPMHPNLMFRVAVREVESWVLADRDGVSSLLGVRKSRIPTDTDSVRDPKDLLLSLARTARSSQVRRDLVPPIGSLRKVGALYNSRLASFVSEQWRVERARRHSASLNRAMRRIEGFKPAT